MHTNTYLGQRLILRIAHFYGDLYENVNVNEYLSQVLANI